MSTSTLLPVSPAVASNPWSFSSCSVTELRAQLDKLDPGYKIMLMLGRRERVDGAGGVNEKREMERLLVRGWEEGERRERKREGERERMWWETKKDSEIKNGAV